MREREIESSDPNIACLHNPKRDQCGNNGENAFFRTRPLFVFPFECISVMFIGRENFSNFALGVVHQCGCLDSWLSRDLSVFISSWIELNCALRVICIYVRSTALSCSFSLALPPFSRSVSLSFVSVWQGMGGRKKNSGLMAMVVEAFSHSIQLLRFTSWTFLFAPHNL